MQLAKLKRKVMLFTVAGAIMLFTMVPSMAVNAAQDVAVTNETSFLGEEQVNTICKAVVKNIEENYAGVYAFDDYDITVHNQTDEGDAL